MYWKKLVVDNIIYIALYGINFNIVQFSFIDLLYIRQ